MSIECQYKIVPIRLC